MPRIPGTSHAQTIFLRAFHASPNGPSPEHWPSPAILRRWLRRPTFARALNEVRQTLRFQADFNLASAATIASRKLSDSQTPKSSKTVHKLSHLLRLAHLRDRHAPSVPPDFAPALAAPQPPNPAPSVQPADGLPSKYDIRAISPENRLTDAEFKQLAAQRHYSPPLRELPSLPVPKPSDSPFYNILSDPAALIWFIYLYNESTADKRFAPILQFCRPLLPVAPPHTLPRLARP